MSAHENENLDFFQYRVFELFERDVKVPTNLVAHEAGDPSLTAAGPSRKNAPQSFAAEAMNNGESMSALSKMALGEEDGEVADDLKQPGKYLATDRGMVGIDGSDSSLARVSIVNYYGAVMMDEFVRQRERVVDYRTQWSGIREKDMVGAKPFKDVQKRVAELIKDRILVGHAIHNDLKALLLSHPWPLTRDTQYFAGKHKLPMSPPLLPYSPGRFVHFLFVFRPCSFHPSLDLHSPTSEPLPSLSSSHSEWEKGSDVGVSSLMARTQEKPKLKKESGDSDNDSEAVAGNNENKDRDRRERGLEMQTQTWTQWRIESESQSQSQVLLS
ncbi:hypothetical protein D9757_009718 [Collybiopsis confluens]|uniref:Exonuclease domain-containing protein n=1 Tax=Collybiopsis confluens TaxID=2823264 RepID=A0A8H5M148_9AGAR|nr:hypothetical protein D9757_009718 [Collybiopsis confluens]